MTLGPGMRFAGPMTGFALQLRKGSVCIQSGCMGRVENRGGREFRRFSMAQKAGIGTAASKLLGV